MERAETLEQAQTQTQASSPEEKPKQTFVEQAKQALKRGQNMEPHDMFALPVGDKQNVQDPEALSKLQQQMAEQDQPGDEIEAKPKTIGKVKIQGMEFDSVDDALDYARQIAAKDAALKELEQEGKIKGSEEEEAPRSELENFFTEIGDMLWQDTGSALGKLFEMSVQTAKQQIVQEQQAKQAQTTAWDGFYSKNPELSEFREVVDYITKRDWAELKDMKTQEGLDEIAQRTRRMLKLKKQAEGAQTELPRTNTMLTPSSQNVQAPVTQEKKLVDFVSELKKYNKRGAKP